MTYYLKPDHSDVIRSIYRGMLSDKSGGKELFCLKFVIMQTRKKAGKFEILKKMKLIDFDKYAERLNPKGKK